MILKISSLLKIESFWLLIYTRQSLQMLNEYTSISRITSQQGFFALYAGHCDASGLQSIISQHGHFVLNDIAFPPCRKKQILFSCISDSHTRQFRRTGFLFPSAKNALPGIGVKCKPPAQFFTSLAGHGRTDNTIFPVYTKSGIKR